jgi:hypothetical protein
MVRKKRKAAVVKPADENWLLKCPEAARAVARGLKEARARRFVKGPDLEADKKLADAIEDDA